MADIKSTSNAAWWIKHPKKNQHRTTLCQDMTDLFSNISMHGYNKLVEAESLLYEKLLWFCLHVINLVVVITILSYTWEQFVRQYFALYLYDPAYPVENIPFPAVAICSNNRISHQAATNYARELSLRDPQNRSVELFLRYIADFSSLYYKFQPQHDYNQYQKFQSFLDIYGTNHNETFFNVRKTLKMLAPNCRDLIVKCLLNGKAIDCFGKDAFETGFTMYGPCCIFNANNSYRKRNSTFSLKTTQLGLTVLLNSSHADDVVSLLNMDAYIVIIHSPNDFADIGSGNAMEVFPTNNVESFIGITGLLIDSSKQLRTFDSSFRKCYFDDETAESGVIFTKTYSYSNCIVNYRIRSILALCNCVPFYVALELKDKIPYCNLHHIACLKRYDFKWRNVFTEPITITGLERESEEGLYCNQCLPSCDDTRYDISMTSLPTDRLVIPDNVGDDFELKVEEMSVLRVYFAKSTAVYYKRVVSNNWQESFSTVGNILSMMMGFSMVAVVEMLFFFIKYLYMAFKFYISSHKDNSKLFKKRFKTKKGKIYILP